MPFPAIFLLDSRHEEIKSVVFLQSAQDVEEAEGEEPAPRLLQGFRETGNGEQKPHHDVLVVQHDLDELGIGEGQILADVVVLLFLRQGDGAVQLVEGLVDQLEQLLAPLAAQHLDVGEMLQAEAVPLGRPLGELDHLLGDDGALRRQGLELHVVHLLGEPQALQQRRIVGMVVEDRDGCQLFESLHQHALGVQVGEAVRSGERDHALFGRPRVLDGADQRGGHIEIVYCVEPAEAQVLRPVLFVAPR